MEGEVLNDGAPVLSLVTGEICFSTGTGKYSGGAEHPVWRQP